VTPDKYIEESSKTNNPNYPAEWHWYLPVGDQCYQLVLYLYRGDQGGGNVGSGVGVEGGRRGRSRR